jgi:hypothetical protein
MSERKIEIELRRREIVRSTNNPVSDYDRIAVLQGIRMEAGGERCERIRCPRAKR